MTEVLEVCSEKTALVGVRGGGMFRSLCDVLDTADPEVKIFRFKDGCQWGSSNGVVRPRSNDAIWHLTIFSHWSEFDVGRNEGAFRVTAVLDPLPGYRAAYEGTTKPEVKKADPASSDGGDDSRCESAILAALETEPRMALRTLKRKISAHRFPTFDACLKRLEDEGVLRTFVDRSLTKQNRVWVELAVSDSGGCIPGSNENADSPVTEK